MKIHGYFLDERLTYDEKEIIYNQCIACLNRICVTDDKSEVLTMLASLQYKAMLLGKNTFLRIDEENVNKTNFSDVYNRAIDDFSNSLSDDLTWLKKLGDEVYDDVGIDVRMRADRLKSGVEKK